MVKSGFTRRSAAQRLRRCHDAVLLLAGAGWEQVQIQLTPAEARRIAEELLAKADTVEKRELEMASRKQISRAIRADRDEDRAAMRVMRKRRQ